MSSRVLNVDSPLNEPADHVTRANLVGYTERAAFAALTLYGAAMHAHGDPVSLGSLRSREFSSSDFSVTESMFAPGAVLPHHRHARSLFAVMLRGSFDAALWHRQLECKPGSVWTEPAEESHANFIGSLGARVIVIQPAPGRDEFFQPFASLFAASTDCWDPSIAADGHRLTRELARPDRLSPVAIESLTLSMLANAARTHRNRVRARPVPAWLVRARELIHAQYLDGFRMADLAKAAGVDPSHLAHRFRDVFHCTVGQYARKLRLEWAVDRVRTTNEPLSQIALAAGYSDQPHFTRHCTRNMGVSPGALRAEAFSD